MSLDRFKPGSVRFSDSHDRAIGDLRALPRRRVRYPDGRIVEIPALSQLKPGCELIEDEHEPKRRHLEAEIMREASPTIGSTPTHLAEAEEQLDEPGAIWARALPDDEVKQRRARRLIARLGIER